MGQELECLQTVGLTPPRTLPAALSQRLWGLDWSHELPWQIDDVTVEPGTFEDAFPFIREHYDEIFGTADGRFFREPMSEAKRRFFAEMDIFILRNEVKTIGLVIGHPTDWSTYYVRSVAFLAEYRARSLLPRFLEHFYGPLADAGVERVETDVSPSNQPVIRLHISQGFMVTASATSERWGALVHFTKFLSEEPENAFMRQFSSMPVRTGLQPTNERSPS
jgi:ribosomal protein S18 acetylase RimI-like enzyme